MMTTMATEKQIEFIRTLGEERVSPTGQWKWGSDTSFLDNLTKVQASAYISKMKALPKKQPTLAGWSMTVTLPKGPVEGIHMVDGTVVKVQRALYGNGKCYTKIFDTGMKKFVKVSGWLKKTSEATLMSKEQAAQFGLLYGVCVRCGRPLTEEESISAGVGPICAGKFEF